MSNKVKAIVDQNGRLLGARALTKRRQLMDSAADLLKKQSLRDLRVVEITRAVNTSPATFYQYFKSVEEVVLELAKEATDKMPSLAKMFEGDWQGEEGLANARKVVDAYITHWDNYGAVLRVRNLAADEGDMRFMLLRSKATAPILEAMSEQIEKRPKQSKNFKPMAAAVAMGAILERLSAYHQLLAVMDITREDLVETSAHILFTTLTASTVK